MGSDLDLHGVYVPLITPFTAGDEVAKADLERLSNEALDAGAAGLIALGTTGEPATLTPAEHSTVIDVVSSVCRDRSAQFLIGVGSNSTRSTLAALDEVKHTPGLTAVLSVVPYYTRPSEAGIVTHFQAVAAASPVPVVVYNIPYRTGRGLGAASLIELSHTANIAGLKQSVAGIDTDTLALMADKAPDFHVLSGDDAFLYSLMGLGGTGAIAASAHVCTNAFVHLVDAALKNNYAEAREFSEALLPVCTALFTEPSPGIVKGVLAAQGKIETAALRAPMTPASTAAVDSALQAINHAEATLARRATS